MKKIIGMVLAVLLCVCFCACGNNASDGTTTEELNLDKTVYFHECEYKVSSEWEEGEQSDTFQYYYPDEMLGIQVGYDNSVKKVGKIKDKDSFVKEKLNAANFEEISSETIGVNGSEGVRIKATATTEKQDVYLVSMIFNVPSGVMSFTVLETSVSGDEIDRNTVDSLSNTLMNTIKINGEEVFTQETETESQETSLAETEESTTEEESKTKETTEETEETEESEDETTTASGSITQNVDSEAVETAKTYLTYAPYSYAGLINQMELEGYTNGEAQKAVNACGVDWEAQALKCAEMYLSNNKSMTKKELKAQMEADGFTKDQINYAVQNVAFD